MAELTGSGGLDLVSKVWSTGYSMRFFGIKTAMQLATTEANKQGAGQDVHSTTVRVSEQSGNQLPTMAERLPSVTCACF